MVTPSILETEPALCRAGEIAERFQQVHRTKARAIFRAPGRVNLIGEHTDYNYGFVMPAAIDFYCYSAIAGRTDRTLSVYSEQFGETVEFNLNEAVGPPRKHWSDYVRGVAATLGDEGYPLKGANLLIDGQVPIGSGLSSSAAIEVATALALTSLGELTIPLLGVARLCQRAENEHTGARCGIMDQFVSCFGKQDHALMLDCRSLEPTYLRLPPSVCLVICNTMVRHELAAGEYNNRRASCERAVEAIRRVLPNVRALRDLTLEDLEYHRSLLTDVDFRRCRHVIKENARVKDAAEALKCLDLMRMGKLMYLSHESLDRDYEVCCEELNIMVEAASKLDGVFGARMTGGGFGGCTVNLVQKEAVYGFKEQIVCQYQARTGLTPLVYVCSPADGAGGVTQ
jgi:galactokinase